MKGRHAVTEICVDPLYAAPGSEDLFSGGALKRH
jgi:hypothetical protein